MKKKVITGSGYLIAAILLLCVFISKYREWEKDQIGGDYQLIAEFESGCTIYEHYNKKGGIIWENYIDGEHKSSVVFQNGTNVQFIGVEAEQVIFMSGRDETGTISINYYDFRESSGIDDCRHIGRIEADHFTGFPAVEETETNEAGFWIKVRYHEEMETLSEEPVVYYAKKISTHEYAVFEEVEELGETDYFGKKPDKEEYLLAERDILSIYEQIEEDGTITWKFYVNGGYHSKKKFDADTKIQFIALEDDYYVYLSGKASEETVQICFENREGLHIGNLPADSFAVLPTVKRFIMDEEKVEVELQYHNSQEELAEEVKIYRTEIDVEKDEWVFTK